MINKSINKQTYRIPVSKPWLTKLERDYLLDAYDSQWLSRGYWCERFEKQFSEYLGVKHVLATSSGSVACHLAVLTSGIQPYQQLYVPNLTYVATGNASLTSCVPVLLGEVNNESWNLDVKFFLEKRIYNKVSGIFLVDLLGNPCNIEQWHAIAKKFGLVLIQDSCESLGAEVNYAGKNYMCGSLLVRSSVFSFYANKNITAGEGGAFCTNHDDVYEHACLLHGQYQHPTKRYYHEDVGYNYRMSNLNGAILCGQLERIDEILEEKERVYKEYQKYFKDSNVIMQRVDEYYRHSYWVIGVKLKNKTNIEQKLNEVGVETRPMFTPLNQLPPYQLSYSFPVSEELYDDILILPSYCQLTNQEIKEISEIVIKNNV